MSIAIWRESNRTAMLMVGGHTTELTMAEVDTLLKVLQVWGLDWLAAKTVRISIPALDTILVSSTERELLKQAIEAHLDGILPDVAWHMKDLCVIIDNTLGAMSHVVAEGDNGYHVGSFWLDLTDVTNEVQEKVKRSRFIASSLRNLSTGLGILGSDGGEAVELGYGIATVRYTGNLPDSSVRTLLKSGWKYDNECWVFDMN